MLLFWLAACQPIEAPQDTWDSNGPDLDDTAGGTDDTGSPPAIVDHCGATDSAGETWSADAVHRVKCDVKVNQGTLTIEAGATVIFVDATALRVGEGDLQASLIVAGEDAAPVVFRPEVDTGAPSYKGVQLGALADGVQLSHLDMAWAGSGNAAILVTDAELGVTDVSIQGSSGDGVLFKRAGRFAEGASGLTVSEVEGAGVRIGADHADSLPREGVDLGTDGLIALRDGTVSAPLALVDLGASYLIDGIVQFEGTADDPATLSVGPGVAFRFATGAGFEFSKDGGASAVVMQGTAESPITLTSYAANERGQWRGLLFEQGTLTADLEHVVVENAGDRLKGAIQIDRTTALLQHVTITGSSSAGLAMRYTGALEPDSTGLLITGNASAIQTTAWGMGTVPADTVVSGNDQDLIWVTQNGDIPASTAWTYLGGTLVIDVDIEVDGTAEAPAVLTLAPGLTLRFVADKGLFVAGNGGAAGLLANGTETQPIVFTPYDANLPGQWAGVGIYGEALAGSTQLTHVTIQYGGGRSLKGNLQFKNAGGTVQDALIQYSSEYGIHVSGDEFAPTLSGITYVDNLSGDLYEPEE